MKKSRILAVVMSVLMMISMLPATVFAAAPAGTLGGELKIKGATAPDYTLSADYGKVTPEGMTDEYVSFLWQRKVSDSDEDPMVELSKEKTYKVTSEDIGYKIVLTVTGLEEKGVTGTLTVTSKTVTEEPDPADLPQGETQEAVPEEQVSGEQAAEEQVQEEYSESVPDEGTQEVIHEEQVSEETAETVPEEQVSEETTEEQVSEEVYDTTTEESQEVIPEYNVQEEVYQTDSTSEEVSEEVEEELTPVEEPGTEDYSEDELTPVEESDVNESLLEEDYVSYNAEAVTADGTGILDFGTIQVGTEGEVEPQTITIRNTGTGTLTFSEITPENFRVDDITEPLEGGQEITLQIRPRDGRAVGTYEDKITYTSDELVSASFVAKVTVEAAPEQPDESAVVNETGDTDANGNTTDTETSSEELPDAETPDTENPDAETPDTEDPDAETPDTEDPDAETPDTENPDGENPDEENPDAEEPEPAVTSIEASASNLTFESVTEGYETSPEAQTVTIANTGNTVIELTRTDSDYFELGELPGMVLNPEETATFTVQPKLGLAEGVYTDVITVSASGENGETVTADIELSFEVKQKPVHKLTVAPGELAFGSVTSGYSEAPKAQTVTITNDGNQTETLQQPSNEFFTVGALSSVELKPGESCTFTVQPNTGLEVSDYMETIQIPNNSGLDIYVTAYLTVDKKKDTSVKLTAVQRPAEITGLANGTEKTAEALGLPGTVVIETTNGNLKASVSWDVKGCAYDAKNTSAQTFTVKGTVTLPSGVTNPNEVSLVTSVKVSVNAYVSNTVSADDNQITGITPNGQYTTKSTISFTAVGAGMDNASPRKGDVRYLPLNWTVVNTNTWTSAPYAASFGMGRSGNYTLSVVFNRQQYDGSNWVNTGDQDTKKVAFSVVQAADQTVTPTPAANQKKAVQTGDDTPIVPLVIILIVAVICIVGVIVYRKKK